MVLLEECQQTSDEVWPVKDLVLPSDQAVNVGVILEGLQGVQRHKREDKWHLLEITCERVDLVLGLDLAHELQAERQILEKISKGLVCFVFFLLFKGQLLLGKRREAIIVTTCRAIEILLLVKMCDVRVSPLDIQALCTVFDLDDIVEDGLVDSIEAACVLRALYFRSKVDLADNELPEELELSYPDNGRNKLGRNVCQVLSEHLIVLQAAWRQCLKVLADRLVVLD